MQYILNNHVLKLILLIDIIYWGVNSNIYICIFNLTYTLIYIMFHNKTNVLIYTKLLYCNISCLFMFKDDLIQYTGLFPSHVPTYFIIIIISLIGNVYFIQKQSFNLILLLFMGTYIYCTFQPNIYYIIINLYLTIMTIITWLLFQYPLIFNKYLKQNYVDIYNINLQIIDYIITKSINVNTTATLIILCNQLDIKLKDNMDSKVSLECIHLLIFLKISSIDCYIKNTQIYIRPCKTLSKYLSVTKLQYKKNISNFVVNPI